MKLISNYIKNGGRLYCHNEEVRILSTEAAGEFNVVGLLADGIVEQWNEGGKPLNNENNGLTDSYVDTKFGYTFMEDGVQRLHCKLYNTMNEVFTDIDRAGRRQEDCYIFTTSIHVEY